MNIHKVYKTLQKQRLLIESSIRNGIMERKEIVFLPMLPILKLFGVDYQELRFDTI